MQDQTQSRYSTKNHILLALPEEDYQRLHTHLEPVHLTAGEAIHQPNALINYVYFPNGSMTSVIAATAGGQAAEVDLVGQEGVSGIDIFLGFEKGGSERVIQFPGSALRIKTEIIREEFKRGGAFQALILRYVRALMKQIGQEEGLSSPLITVEQRLVGSAITNKPTVFLIDEDDDSRPSFRKYLKQSGYQVSIAFDEEDALDRVSHQCLKADLVLMNFIRKPPEEVLEIGTNIRRVGNLDTPIVVIAHKYGADLEGKDIKVGENDYITYLEDGDQLYSLISSLMPKVFDERIIG
jgi:CheY-like chemotaxis protein